MYKNIYHSILGGTLGVDLAEGQVHVVDAHFMKYYVAVRSDRPVVDATRRIYLKIKELSTKSKRENKICVSQCPINKMETTINILEGI